MKLSKQEKAARRAAFQEMDAKDKLDYILTYYKHIILLVLAALILLGSAVHHSLTRKEAVFYLGLINVSIGDDLTFSLNKEYLDKTGTDFRKNEIVLYPGMYLSEDAATENHSYAYFCQKADFWRIFLFCFPIIRIYWSRFSRILQQMRLFFQTTGLNMSLMRQIPGRLSLNLPRTE